MERDWLSTFPHSLFISYIKICHILMQNAKYGTFVANVTKIITYALWGNTSGSDLLRGSSASCASLTPCMCCKIFLTVPKLAKDQNLPAWPEVARKNPRVLRLKHILGSPVSSLHILGGKGDSYEVCPFVHNMKVFTWKFWRWSWHISWFWGK